DIGRIGRRLQPRRSAMIFEKPTNRQKVAAYIHDAFYSPLGQARNKPARIELSRLTVRQYQNAVADLVGSFRTPGRWTCQSGRQERGRVGVNKSCRTIPAPGAHACISLTQRSNKVSGNYRRRPRTKGPS